MSLEVKILGSNAAAPAHHRNQSAQVVRVQNQTFLVDCGEGTQIQAKKYGIRINKINHILISHLHGDHYYGLMGLLSTMHLYGRETGLRLYGPPGLSEIITLQLRYSETALSFDLDFHEITPGTSEVIFENLYLTVRTFPLNHRISCSGFVFQEKPKRRRINKAAMEEEIPPVHINALKDGKDVLDDEGHIRYSNELYTLPPRRSYSYAYCSDTKYDESILEYITGINLLYHESTFTKEFEDRARDTFHSTAEQAAQMAHKAGVDKLILGHFSNRYKDLTPILMEAKLVFEQSALAIEGESFILDT
ncbi:MAG: ribonuclease Z [Cyclobacteriaceae bacterium]